MVERWLVPLIPFPSYKLCASDRPGAVKGARFARRSEPLTARTDLESYEGEGKGILQPSSHLPTKNPEEPLLKTWWPGTELNRRRRPFQGRALPTELPGQSSLIVGSDPETVKQPWHPDSRTNKGRAHAHDAG